MRDYRSNQTKYTNSNQEKVEFIPIAVEVAAFQPRKLQQELDGEEDSEDGIKNYPDRMIIDSFLFTG